MEELNFNSKGQAAVTDALFMLVIISSLCVMMFVFASTYGQSTSAHILRQYSVDYATDALKSILYSSTPRNPNERINFDPAQEVDYLMAVVKEDYADFADDKLELSPKTKILLKKNIELVMQPLSDQFDYLFTIIRRDKLEYIYVVLYKSEFRCFPRNADGSKGTEVLCEAEERNVIIEAGAPSHQFYFCEEVDSRKMASLLYAVGESSQANSPMLLLEPHSVYGIKTTQAQSSLVIWPAALISDAMLSDMGCNPVS